MICLETPRLILRDHLLSDLAALHAWMSNPTVMAYLNWKTTKPEETLKHLQASLAENANPQRTKYFFAIVCKETREIIGDVGLTVLSLNGAGRVGELGYFLLPRYWGKRYATEAAQEVIDFGFAELHLAKIIANCDRANLASERVMQRSGMQKDPEYAERYILNGAWRERVGYAIVKSENLC
jgi:[ribosomal protein S5]-alanine N-acetyltransferase